MVRRIAAALAAHGCAVDVHKGDALPAGLVADDHDGIVVAASIIVGRYQGYSRAFVKRHLVALTDRPAAFVSVSGGALESNPR